MKSRQPKLIDKEKLFKRIKEDAGPRYTPEIHTPIDIEKNLYTLTKDEKFFEELSSKYLNLKKRARYHSWKMEEKIAHALVNKLLEHVLDSFQLIQQGKQVIWKRRAKTLTQIAEGLYQEYKNVPEKKEERENYVNYLLSMRGYATDFAEFFNSEQLALTLNRRLLITGQASTGKTHLLADFAVNRIKGSEVALILFGNRIDINKSLQEQLISLTSWSGDFKGLMKVLNADSTSHNTRVPIIIDGINETDYKYIQSEIIQLEKTLKNYENIALIVSIRNGYEDRVLQKKFRNKFIQIEHYGFGESEIDYAYNNFCDYYGVNKSEVPVLSPEFNNPLFLKMFCETHDARKHHSNPKKRKIGHVYLTDLFEDFVIYKSETVLKKLGITDKQRKRELWNKLIKDFARKMIETDSKLIDLKDANRIIEQYDSKINKRELLKLLENEGVIIEYDWNSQIRYGFAYHKFSDHLIVRTQLSDKLKIKKKRQSEFKKGGSIFDFIGSYQYDYGIIEALFIQVPERMQGEKKVELFDLVPTLRKDYYAVQALTQSLIWRDPDTLGDRIESVVQQNFMNGRAGFIDACITLSLNKDNRLNATLADKLLKKMSMPERDSIWSAYLGNHYYSSQPVDRVIRWSLREDATSADYRTAELASYILTWFFTTSHRAIRDKATRGLVNVLRAHPKLLEQYFKRFRNVNDPYVLERVLAVVYSSISTNINFKNKLNYKQILNVVFDYYYKKGNLPVNIKCREYIRNIIELGLYFKLCTEPKSKVQSSINPSSYSSNRHFLKGTPTTKELEKKYKAKDMKYGDLLPTQIWSSLMYHASALADFGNYVLGSNVGRWSFKKKYSIEKPIDIKIEDFKRTLSKLSLMLWEELYRKEEFDFSQIDLKILLSSRSEEGEYDWEQAEKERKKEEKDYKKKKKAFVASLPKSKVKKYFETIEPYIHQDGRSYDPLERFDENLARNWVFTRVMSLGWNGKLHGEFDQTAGRLRAGRQDNSLERMGKKYQWIALFELLARISDNYVMKDERDGEKEEYKGLWQLTLRDMDPTSLLIPRGTGSSIVFDQNMISNAYTSYGVSNPKKWLSTTNDLPDVKSFVKVEDKNGVRWLLLEGIFTWTEETSLWDEKYNSPTKQLYYFFKSYLIKNNGYTDMLRWLKKQHFKGRWMPETHEFYEIDLAQFPWSPSFKAYTDLYFGWRTWAPIREHSDSSKPPKHKILTTADEYLSSDGGTDNSRESSRSYLPNQIIANEMRLQFPACRAEFYNKKGDLVFADPSVQLPELPNMLLVREDLFMDYLKKNNYKIFWTLLFEKNMIGGNGMFSRLEGSKLLYLDKDSLRLHSNKTILPKDNN